MGEEMVINQIMVREVEKRKCLYDYTCAAYSDRELQDLKWQEIADILGCTVDECRARWKNLRGGMTRYLSKPMTSSGMRHVKKYYLFDDMQFLMPFMRTRGRTTKKFGKLNQSMLNSPKSIESNDQDISSDYEIEIKQDLSNNIDENFNDNAEQQQNCDDICDKKRKLSDNSYEDGKSSKKLQQQDVIESSLDDAVKLYFFKKISKENNPDLEFFKSILPDIANFDSFQKRLFKQKVLQLIDQIAENQNEDDEDDIDDTTNK